MASKKRGRPRRTRSDAKARGVRLTDAEFKGVSCAAKKLGVTTSEVLRIAAAAYVERVTRMTTRNVQNWKKYQVQHNPGCVADLDPPDGKCTCGAWTE